MQEPTSNQEILLNEINHKFQSSCTNQEEFNMESAQTVVCSDFLIKKQLETQPQTPLKQQLTHKLNEKQISLQFIEVQSKIIQEKSENQNQIGSNQSINEFQIQLTYSPQKSNQNLQTEQNNHQQIENTEKYERLITVQPQELQEQLITYQSLTQKFEVALSRLKHTQSISPNLNEFAARQQHYMKKKTTELNLLRQQKQKQVSKLCPAKPLINSRSQQLLVNHKPIHSRYQGIIEEKKKKLEKQQAEQLAKKIEQEEQELNQIKEHQQEIRRKLGNKVRTQTDYYNQMKSWVQTRDKKVEDLALRKKQETKHQATFKPVINQKSQLLMKKNTPRIAIYDKAPLPKTNFIDTNCTFKPNLTKKSLKR